MHPESDRPDHIERRQELIEEEEAFRLRQEKRRLALAQRSMRFDWIARAISYLVGALEVLLILRFLLRLFGANTDNMFASFIYNLSEPFIAPFSTLFISPVTGGGANIFDVNVLIAMIVYAILGWLALLFLRYFQGR